MRMSARGPVEQAPVGQLEQRVVPEAVGVVVT
jgi:hypothetical protein